MLDASKEKKLKKLNIDSSLVVSVISFFPL